MLINNLGTPDSASVKDVRKFLKEFLWDPRVVKLSRPIWWLVLNLFILNTRPKRSATAYKKIWSEQGSPLLAITEKIAEEIRQSIISDNPKIRVEVGMRYGNPSITDALKRLHDAGANQIFALPMYPQFSHTTTASVEDEVSRVMKHGSTPYEILNNYHDNADYIHALSNSVKTYWQKHNHAEQLLMSFHGIPQEYSDDGDPYQSQCIRTAELLAQSLNLKSDQWKISFQSRLGPKQWLEPYTDKTLAEMANEGVKSVQVICPGFSVDCLETLEETAMENQDVFMNAGGQQYSYIPCLNDSSDHIRMLMNLIKNRNQ